MRRVAAVGFLVLLLACGGADRGVDGAAAGVVIRDSAGVTIVENLQPAWPAGSEWRPSPAPRVSLDDTTATGGVPYIPDAMRLPGGDILVVAGSAVRWFDASGELRRVIAGAGNGPGEFRGINQLMLRGDTVVIAGYANGSKLAFFGPDGALLRDEILDFERYSALGRWSECNTEVLPDGSRVGCQVDPSIPTSATNRSSQVDDRGWSSPGPGLLRQLRRAYVATPALDTAYPLGLDMGIEQFGVDMGGGETNFIVHPLHARTIITSGGIPSRIAMATGPGWEVQLWTPDGRLERIIRHVQGRRAPTPEEVRTATMTLRKQELSRARDTAATERALAEVPTPDSLPGVLLMTVSRSGMLAVTRGGLWADGVPMIVDLFDAAGRWQGPLELPPRWRLLDFGEDYLLGVRYDSDDVPHLELYGLAPGDT